ncbi:halocyanin [Haloarcula sp. CBA1115]|uniref:halocyanin domain-containing protein n=1 Tax=unclassified Haloarcula TaxID=2624677 RepID=UPI0005955966|nr:MULTISPECIES: halocyanin domain-containing protein [unclassified Haloarcula]AJF24461.1 halocyanin [Haloarcula sp. CBA1115]
MPSSNRRTFLGASVVGLGSLVGFSRVRAENSSEPSTPHETEDTESVSTIDPLDEWLLSANDPQGQTIRDLRYNDPPTVYLGITGTKSFAPPAIKVTPGTTVTWDWIGDETEHNVVAIDGTFDSGQPIAEAGNTFEYTFETEGTYKYVSEPHEEVGMKGVVVVASAPSSGYPTVDKWLAATDEYDGSITDETGTDFVEIASGAEGNGGNLAFDPHAIKVSTGTTIRWNWIGKGGAHNIVFDDSEIGEESIYAKSGVHFEETFTKAGIYRYSCEPHHSIGHRGAIIVE